MGSLPRVVIVAARVLLSVGEDRGTITHGEVVQSAAGPVTGPPQADRLTLRYLGMPAARATTRRATNEEVDGDLMNPSRDGG